jgi:hypothetical protein
MGNDCCSSTDECQKEVEVIKKDILEKEKIIEDQIMSIFSDTISKKD